MSPWLKAGLIGAGILILIALIGLIPISFLGCLISLLTFLAYFGIGALAASYMAPPREAGSAAGQGALAGLLASVIGGLFSLVVAMIRATVSGVQALSQIPPGMLQQLRDSGISPEFVAGPGGAAIGGTICCGAGIVVGVIFAAIGAAIYAAAKNT